MTSPQDLASAGTMPIRTAFVFRQKRSHTDQNGTHVTKVACEAAGCDESASSICYVATSHLEERSCKFIGRWPLPHAYRCRLTPTVFRRGGPSSPATSPSGTPARSSAASRMPNNHPGLKEAYYTYAVGSRPTELGDLLSPSGRPSVRSLGRRDDVMGFGGDRRPEGATPAPRRHFPRTDGYPEKWRARHDSNV